MRSLEELIGRGVITLIGLNEFDEIEFEQLVVGSGLLTLDDGEAATIAAAYGRGHVAIIDERKGRRICAERYPRVVFGDTCDLLAHPRVEEALGHEGLREAIVSALRGARMPISNMHLPWAIEIIGEDAALELPSLRRRWRTIRAESVNFYVFEIKRRKSHTRRVPGTTSVES